MSGCNLGTEEDPEGGFGNLGSLFDDNEPTGAEETQDKDCNNLGSLFDDNGSTRVPSIMSGWNPFAEEAQVQDLMYICPQKEEQMDEEQEESTLALNEKGAVAYKVDPFSDFIINRVSELDNEIDDIKDDFRVLYKMDPNKALR
jgi:hypothetical protein